MPRFEVVGIGRETGRKRVRIYEVVNKETAIMAAASDGTIVEVGKITQLPDEPASEKRIAQAKVYGVEVPENVTKKQINEILTKVINKYYPPSDDPPNALRFKSNYPDYLLENYQLIDNYFVAVAGTSYREEAVYAFVEGNSQAVKVVSAPSSKYPHAFAVIGLWMDSLGNFRQEHIGYVPDEDAREISKILKKNIGYIAEGKLAIIYMSVEEKSPGIRIDVGLFKPKKT